MKGSAVATAPKKATAAKRKPDADPLAAEFELYDLLAAKKRSLYGALEDEGRTVRAVVEAALDGRVDELEAVAVAAPTDQELKNTIAGAESAQRAIKDRIVQAAGLGATPAKLWEHLPKSADELRRLVDQVGADQLEGRARELERREAARRYDEASAEYSAKRMAHIKAGDEPVVATQRAKSELGARADNLFPPGSPGGPNGGVVSGSQVFR